MPKYLTGSRKADAEIDIAVNAALAQVTASPLSPQDRLEYSYLLVREKLDRMEESGKWDHLSMGVSDTDVCESVIVALAKTIGVAPSTNIEYPEALPTLSSHGLTLLA